MKRRKRGVDCYEGQAFWHKGFNGGTAASLPEDESPEPSEGFNPADGFFSDSGLPEITISG